ncbi:MAG: tetratricopeptide repeat protein [Verrucomicrobia bacterium]|nr:tetratricopeptide repeat protein [Verrucomicrobiota bacterium]
MKRVFQSKHLRQGLSRCARTAATAILLNAWLCSDGVHAEETDDPDALRQEIESLYKQRKFDKAIPLAQKLVEITEKTFGSDHPNTAASLNNLAGFYKSQGDYSKAEPLYQRATDIWEKALGPEHPYAAVGLANLAALYQDKGERTKAESLYERALKIEEKAYGEDDLKVIPNLNNLAWLYEGGGDLARAEPLLERALQIREKKLGAEHPDTRSSLVNLAGLYRVAGENARAEPLYRRSLAIMEKSRKADDREILTDLNNLAEVCRELGAYEKAEPLYERALKIEEKFSGPEHPNTVKIVEQLAALCESKGQDAKAEAFRERVLKIAETSRGAEHPETAAALNNLGMLHKRLGHYARAEPLFQRALGIREKALGAEHADTATSLNNLAALYDSMGEYAKAEPLCQRALAIREKVLEPEHADIGQSLNNLALLYKRKGDHLKAEPLYQRALKIWEKTLGPEHPDTATSLNNLAELYRLTGEYAKAEPLYQRALKIWEKTLGPEHPDTAAILNNLAELYRTTGDYARAEPMFERALKILEKAFGPDHPDTAAALNNLASLYRQMGDPIRAEPLFKHSLEICEKKYGPDHAHTITSVGNLAELYRDMSNYAKAEPLLQRVVRSREKTRGPDHPHTAVSLTNLGSLYRQMGDYARAEPIFQRVVNICERNRGLNHPHTLMSMGNLAELYCDMEEYAKAEPILQKVLENAEKSFAPDDPLITASLNSLALAYLHLGKEAEALTFANRAQQTETKALAKNLSFATEQQRLSYQAAQNPYFLLARMGNASRLAMAVLRNKGVMLESLLENRRIAAASKDPRYQAVIGELRSARQRLIQWQSDAPPDSEDKERGRRDSQREVLAKQVEQLEIAVGRQVPGIGRARRALGVTPEEVQACLSRQAMLIEFVKYWHNLGKNKWEERYGAVLIGGSGKPGWISIGNADAIDRDVKLYRTTVRGKPHEAAMTAVLQALYRKIWMPLEKSVPADVKTIVISPDGSLNLVSFATLLDDSSQFFGQKFVVRYVSSGRDLLRDPKPVQEGTIDIYADPNFGGKEKSNADKAATSQTGNRPSPDRQDARQLRLSQPTGAAEELTILKKNAGAWGCPVNAFVRDAATEVRLAQTRSPLVLHLATDSFFLPETEFNDPGPALRGFELESGKGRPKIMQSPFRRCGLAMTDAQAALDAAGGTEIPSNPENGILTAEEISDLNLNGTWLVAISACESAAVEGKAGGDIQALRCAFVHAGTQHLLMPLWRPKEEDRSRFLGDFYHLARKSGDLAQSFADTQRDWMTRLRKEQGLVAAVTLAGPFVLSSQGRQYGIASRPIR